MLFTRCPDCETTFRITDDALKKANGQVRCGRCASVFNAYAELHDPSAQSVDAAEAPPPPAATVPAAPPPAAAPTAATSTLRASAEPVTTDSVATVATVVAEVALAEAEAQRADESDAVATDAAPISARQVDEVLTDATTPPLPAEPPTWTAFGAEPPAPAASRWWGVAAALAAFAFGAQAMHHYRADIAGHATFGPWIQRAYALAGVTLTPRWNVQQYAILDWVATAEPNARGLGSLKIAARIQNRGPLQQPYPVVQLRLKDRWEKAVSSRLVAPAEYLSRDTPRGRLMAAGETARAEIEVVDPGPDAYGFELDVCIEVEASTVTCGADAVFL